LIKHKLVNHLPEPSLPLKAQVPLDERSFSIPKNMSVKAIVELDTGWNVTLKQKVQ